MSKKAKSKAKPKTKAAGSGGRSKFWPGLIVGGGLAAAAVHYRPGWLNEWSADAVEETSRETTGASKAKKDAAPPEKAIVASTKLPSASPAEAQPPAPPPGSPAKPGGTPAFFLDPARAANLLTRLGMGES